MSLPRIARPSRLWRALGDCASTTSCQTRVQRRALHRMPPLINAEKFETDGVRGLLSEKGYEIAWTQYQGLMLERLNRITEGMDEDNMELKPLILQFARNPGTAALFNFASMAHNNHFFFDGLAHSPRPLSDHKPLHESLVATFGSIETLKKTMIDTAYAMFGPGFVWLVMAEGVSRNSQDSWRILTTYQAGTPYPEAGYRRQDHDMNTAENSPANSVGRFGSSSAHGKRQEALPPGAARVTPVLCVSTWEHVYLRDYGVRNKRQYLNNWWNAIDWHVVAARTPNRRNSFQTM